MARTSTEATGKTTGTAAPPTPKPRARRTVKKAAKKKRAPVKKAVAKRVTRQPTKAEREAIDQRCLELRRLSFTYRQIADELNLPVMTVHQSAERARLAVPGLDTEAHRTDTLDQLDRIFRNLAGVARRATEAEDDTKLRLVSREQVAVLERKAALLGLDIAVPRIIEIKIINREALMAERERLKLRLIDKGYSEDSIPAVAELLPAKTAAVATTTEAAG